MRVRHLHANGRIGYVNLTFLAWSGHAADQMVGKRFSDFLTMPGRIYYETHIAPLLRMLRRRRHVERRTHALTDLAIPTVLGDRDIDAGLLPQPQFCFMRAGVIAPRDERRLRRRDLAQCVDDVLVAGDVRRIGLWTDNDARLGRGRSN